MNVLQAAQVLQSFHLLDCLRLLRACRCSVMYSFVPPTVGKISVLGSSPGVW